MKLFSSFRSPSSSKNHRHTLLDLHRSGAVQVFRRHSIFRVWIPLRETFAGPDAFTG